VANSINVGRAGEFLVAAELEQRGIRCHRVDMQDDDLWVKSATGELLTMQVKATLEPRGDRERKPCYMFTRANGDAQIFAYVALDIRLFILRTAPSGKTVRIKPCYMFTRANGDAQIFAYVALDIRLFILRTAPSGKTVRIKPADFTRQAMDDSIEAMLG